MMNKHQWIKLTSCTGNAGYFRKDLISVLFPEDDPELRTKGQTYLYIKHYGGVTVKESPEEIIKLMGRKNV